MGCRPVGFDDLINSARSWIGTVMVWCQCESFERAAEQQGPAMIWSYIPCFRNVQVLAFACTTTSCLVALPACGGGKGC